METLTAIKGRRSIRRYKDGEVPRKDIEQMLEAAMLAPSAMNSRPWTFVVVTNRDIKNKVAESHPYGRMAAYAPCMIVVCGMESQSEFWQQDCGAAIENMLLCAEDLGYGACWCGLYPNPELVEIVRNAIGRTEGTPMAAIMVGIPDQSPACRGKYEESKVRFID